VAKKGKKRPSSSAGSPVAPVPLVVNPLGPTQQRRIKRAKIGESVFTLDDGTKLVLKPTIADVRRAVRQYNQFGQPLYFLTIGYLIDTRAPKNLLKSAPKRRK